MLRFAIGVDKRAGRFGADLERYLRCSWDLADFEVVGLNCKHPQHSVKALQHEAKPMLQELMDYPAHYYVAVASGKVLERTTAGLIPIPITVVNVIDVNGVILYDCLKSIGYYLPVHMRQYRQPLQGDVLDLIHGIVASLDGPGDKKLRSPARSSP